MDVTANEDEDSASERPVENMYWQHPPPGRYEFWVENNNDRNENVTTDYTVRITLDDAVVFEQRFDDASPEYKKLPAYILIIPEADRSEKPEPEPELELMADPRSQKFAVGERVIMVSEDGKPQRGVVGTVLACKGPNKSSYEVDFGPAMMKGPPTKRKHKMYHNFLLRPASAMEESTPSPEQETDGSTRSNVATDGTNLFAGSPDPFADMLSLSGSPSPDKRTRPGRSQASDLFATDAAPQGGTDNDRGALSRTNTALGGTDDVDDDRDALVRTNTAPVKKQHRTPESLSWNERVAMRDPKYRQQRMQGGRERGGSSPGSDDGSLASSVQSGSRPAATSDRRGSGSSAGMPPVPARAHQQNRQIEAKKFAAATKSPKAEAAVKKVGRAGQKRSTPTQASSPRRTVFRDEDSSDSSSDDDLAEFGIVSHKEMGIGARRR